MRRKLLMALLLAASLIFGAFGLVACQSGSYSVNFMVDGKIYATVSTIGNETIKMPQDPQKGDGYTFDGWYLDQDTWKEPFTADYFAEKEVSSVTTVYSKWIVNEKTGADLLSFTDGEIVEKTVFTRVSNETDSFSFADKITVSDGASWIISRDIDGAEVVNDTISLNEGDNEFYIIVASGNGKNHTEYTVNVYRNKMFTVSFDVKGGSPVPEQIIEEGKTATRPTSEKAGYVLTWDYNFEIPIISNITVTAKWTAEDKIPYKIEHYLQNVVNDEYTLDETKTENMTGTVNATATATALPIDHFTAVSASVSGTIVADGSLVLRLYYNRVKYTVTFDGNGAALVSGDEVQQVKYEGNAVAPVYSKPGYSNGWDKPTGNISENVTITAAWEANADTIYKIEYYTEGLTGQFVLDRTEVKVGTTDTTATVTPESMDHFTVSEDSSLSGIIAGDGSLVLAVKYARETYTVTFDGNGGTRIGGGEETQSIKYGGKAVAPSYSRAGYIGGGFDKAIDNVSADVTVNAVWTARDDIEYAVEVYLQNLNDDDYTLTSGETLTGTMDEIVSAADDAIDGFVYNSDKSIKEGTVLADGSLVLKLYYDREVYTVTFDGGEGTLVSGEEEQTVKYGGSAAAPVYELAGYTYIFDAELDNIEENIKITAEWAARDDIEYTVKYYFQNLEDDEYTLDTARTKTLQGMTGEEITVTPESVDHFTVSEDSSLSGIIAGDGTLVIEVYYNRETYSVSIKAYDDPDEDDELVTIKEEYDGEYKYGTKIEAVSVKVSENADWQGWFVVNEGDSLSFLSNEYNGTASLKEDINIVAKATRKTVNYTVETYLQNITDDEYTCSSETLTGGAGLKVELEPADIEHFTFNKDHEGNVLSGTIAANGSLVLKLYYTRNTYNVSVSAEYKDLVTIDPSYTGSIKYGTVISSTAALTENAASFDGWYVNGNRKTENLTYPAFTVSEDVTIVAKAVRKTVGYTVETYSQNVNNDEYTASSETLTGGAGLEVTVTPKTITGFTFNENHEGNVLSGTIKADGSLVLKLYYDRETYTVTFNGDGIAPTSGTEVQTVKYQGSAVAPVYERAGYTYIFDAELDNIEENITITAVWVARNDTAYTVEVYKQNLEDDNYTLDSSETLTGTTDTTATATAGAITGFTFDAAKSTASGNIAGDGNLVLTLYYNRNICTITFNGNGGTLVSGAEIQQVRYGGVATAPTYERAGYTLSYSVSLENVTSDLNVLAIWTANTDTQYNVKYYLQNIADDNYTEDETHAETRTGTTGTTATVMPKAITGFTPVTESVSGVIAGDGSLIIKLYYDRNIYTVTFNGGDGTLVSGAETQTVRYQGAAKAPVYERDGYDFKDFDVSYTNVTENITVTAEWIKGGAQYTVEYYLQNLINNEYALSSELGKTARGVIGETAEVTPETITGFTYNESKSTVSGTITADNSLALKLYYDRNTYTVTFNGNGGTRIGGGNTVQSVKYGGEATAPNYERAGYTFNGFDKTLDNVSANVTVNAVWTANTDTAYTVEYYLQNLEDDNYEIDTARTLNATGTTDTTATATIIEVEHFSFNAALSNVSGNIAGDGTLVLRVYYTRVTYTVTFDGNGGTRVGGGNTVQSVKYKGAAIAPVYEQAGYVFNGFDKTFDSITEAITVTAQWIADTNTKYTVEYYYQNLANDKYTIEETQTLGGETGSTATVTPEVPAHYILNEDSSVLSGTITSDGKLKLKVYFDRETYTVTFNGNGGTRVGGGEETQTVKYEGSAVVPIYSLAGYAYALEGVYKNVDKNENVTAVWTANTDTAYTVKYYLQNLEDDDYTLDSSETLTGTTDTTATVTPETITGFTPVSESVSGTIAGDGSLVLEVYYTRNVYHVSVSTDNDYVTLSKTYDEDMKFGATVSSIIATLIDADAEWFGWSVNGDVTTESMTYPTFTVAGNLIIIAKAQKQADLLIIENNILVGVNDKEVQVIKIPDTVVGIGDGALEGCTMLTSIVIPNSVLTIGKDAFKGCSALTSITIPSSVTSIGANAFSGCPIATATVTAELVANFNSASIKTLTISGGTEIPANALNGCAALTSITLPDTLTTIGANAFKDCTALTRIAIPTSVTTIEANAFSGAAIERIDYAGTQVQWASIDGLNNIMASGRTLYLSNKALTSVSSLTGATEIKPYAFAYQSTITTINIPTSVTTIGENAFIGCSIATATISANYVGMVNSTLLTKLTINQGTEIADNALAGCTALNSLTIQSAAKITRIGANAFKGCSALTTTMFPNALSTLTTIGANAFEGCTSLNATLTIPANVTSIGENAFKGCTSITTVKWNATACTVAGSSANPIFTGCTNIATITIGSSVTNIPAYAFKGLTAVTTITIPSKITAIGDGAFAGCTGITEVAWNATACTVAGSSANPIFTGCTNIEEASFNTGITTIPAYAFKGLSKITAISLPTSKLATIGESAFEGVGITTISIPAKITSLGANAFKNSSLVNVTIASGATGINATAFSGCTIEAASVPAEYVGYVKSAALSALTITGGTEIPANALNGCTALSSITLPTTLTTIGANAFNGCSGLTSISIPANVTSIGSGAFTGTGITSIYYAGNVSSWVSIDGLNNIMASGRTLYISNATLTSVDLSGVSSVKAYAFAYQTTIKTVVIPATTTVGENAFTGCAIENATIPMNQLSNIKTAALKTLTITNGTALADNALSGCTALTSITLPATLTTIGSGAFNGCAKLTSITIPATVTSIGANAFNGCSALTKIYYEGTQVQWVSIDGLNNIMASGRTLYINNATLTSVTISGITVIKAYAFAYQTTITTITIPVSVTTIGENAFVGCPIATATVPTNYISLVKSNNLKTLTITGGTAIAANALNGCTALEKVTINSTVTSIGASAFSGCIKLNDVSLANSITSIGNSAFSGCTALTSIVIPDSVTTLGTNVFSGCSKLTSVTLSSAITTINTGLFNGCSVLTEITLPAGITSIGTDAFKSCTKLTKIRFTGTASQWASISGLANIMASGRALYLNGATVTTVTITGITEIKAYAFAYQTSLTTVNIEDSITTIGENAFLNCTALTAFNLDGFAKSTTIGKSSGTTNWQVIEAGATTTPTVSSSSDNYTKMTGLTVWSPRINYTKSVLTDGLSVYFKADNLATGDPRIGFSFASATDAYGPETGLFSAVLVNTTDYYILYYCNSHDNAGTNVGYRNFDGTNFSGTDYGPNGVRAYAFTKSGSAGFKLYFERVGSQAYKVTISNINGLVDGSNSLTVYVPSQYVPDSTLISVWGMGDGAQNIYTKLEYTASMTADVTFKANSLKNTSALKAITVGGSIEAWQTMTKTSGWNTGSGITNVICDEGTLDINTTYAVKNGKLYIVPETGKIELIQDQSFLTGISVGSTTMNDGAIYGRLDYNGTATLTKYYTYWKLSQWHAAPSIVNTSTGAVNGTYTKNGNTHTYSNDAKVIRINQDKKEIYLEIDTRKVQASSGSTTSDHPHHLIEKEFGYSPKFSELSALRLSFKFKVERFDDVGYNGGQAAQCSWYFYLSNDNGSQTMFFGFNCYDDRWDYYGKNEGEKGDSVSWEQNAGNAVVKAGRDRWANFGNNNRVSVGTEYTVNIDVFAMVDQMISQLHNEYSQYNVTRDDLHIGSFNWGWEMPGIKTAAGIAISDISVLATYK